MDTPPRPLLQRYVQYWNSLSLLDQPQTLTPENQKILDPPLSAYKRNARLVYNMQMTAADQQSL